MPKVSRSYVDKEMHEEEESNFIYELVDDSIAADRSQDFKELEESLPDLPEDVSVKHRWIQNGEDE